MKKKIPPRIQFDLSSSSYLNLLKNGLPSPITQGRGVEGVANYAASHLGEGCAYIRFFVCVPKVFNKTNENVLTMCNNV